MGCARVLNEAGVAGLQALQPACEALLAQSVCCQHCNAFDLRRQAGQSYKFWAGSVLPFHGIAVDCNAMKLVAESPSCCGTNCYVQNCAAFVTKQLGGTYLLDAPGIGGAMGSGGRAASAYVRKLELVFVCLFFVLFLFCFVFYVVMVFDAKVIFMS